MSVLEVFFDYSCPYCLRGHEHLVDLLPNYPAVEIKWCPCEAHPRPENHGRHSDLCIQGLYWIMEQDADLWAFHDAMYKAACTDRKIDANIEDAAVLAKYVEGIADPAAFEAAIRKADYQRVHEANVYAFEKNGVWAVPSFRMDGMKLDSIEGVGVTRQQLADFMAMAK